MIPNSTSILLIYAEGTTGMMESTETGASENFSFKHLQKHVPEFQNFTFHIDTYQFDPPVDLSDMNPDTQRKLVRITSDNYERYIGFVILHGTGTMVYTASVLSFMLEGLNKPVILTGSQLPIGVLRMDDKEDLLTNIEIVTARRPDGRPFVPKVCIFFENHLIHSNRTTKINAENFSAFRSLNYPVLAFTDIRTKYNNTRIYTESTQDELQPHYLLDTNITILKLLPDIQENVVDVIPSIKGLKVVVLETYSSGSAPRREWFLRRLHDACEQGVVTVNVTQYSTGMAEMERYETGYRLMQTGIVCGYDSTTESVITKLMFLLGYNYFPAEVRELMNYPIAGEIMIT